MLSKLLTKSRLADARTCQRLHAMKYLQGYRPRERARALVIGSTVGEGLDRIWVNHELVIPELPSDAPVEDYYDRARMTAMLLGYQQRWQEEDSVKYEVLGCELEFRCALINPLTGRKSETWELAGKLDKLVRERETGEVWVVEHKTTSEDISPGSPYWACLRMDTQVSIYHVGARSLGYDVRGVIYDVLVKPGQRPSQVPVLDEGGVKIVLDATGARVTTKDGKKWRETGDAAQGFALQVRAELPEEYERRCVDAIAAAPDEYYRRAPVPRLEKDIDDALVDIWQQGQQMREAERAGRAPRNPEACKRWGRMCEFFPCCSGETSLQDETLYRLSTNVHPELTGPNAPREGAEVADASTTAETGSTEPAGPEARGADDPTPGTPEAAVEDEALGGHAR